MCVVFHERMSGKYRAPASDAEQLYDGCFQKARTKIQVGTNLWLSHKKDESDAPKGKFELYLLENDDSVLWQVEIGGFRGCTFRAIFSRIGTHRVAAKQALSILLFQK